jgi:hypothetical protein
MVVGVCHIVIIFHDNHSIKDKRRLLKSLIEKTRDRFNVSVAEVGSNDLWQKAEVALAAVGNDAAFVNSSLDRALDYIESLHAGEIMDSSVELITL